MSGEAFNSVHNADIGEMVAGCGSASLDDLRDLEASLRTCATAPGPAVAGWTDGVRLIADEVAEIIGGVERLKQEAEQAEKRLGALHGPLRGFVYWQSGDSSEHNFADWVANHHLTTGASLRVGNHFSAEEKPSMLDAAKHSLATAEECEHKDDLVSMRDELLLGILQSNIALAEALRKQS